MAKSKLVGLLFDSWTDMDRVVAGLNAKDALENIDGGSSIAWTFAHMANGVDSWVNVLFQEQTPQSVLGQHRYRTGGSGRTDEWESIQVAAQQVRDAARNYLQDLDDGVLESTVRERDIVLRYVVMGQIGHHYFHIGEIATKREGLGHDISDDFPGALAECR